MADQKTDEKTVDTKTQDTPKTLDELLAEWPADDQQAGDKEQRGNGKTGAPTAEEFASWRANVDRQLKDVSSRTESFEEIATERHQQAIVKLMRESNDELSDRDDDQLLTLVIGEMGRNDALLKAWENRNRHPAEWKKVAKGLADKLATNFPTAKKKGDDEDAATKRLVGRAASRTSTTSKAPDPGKEEDARAMAMSDAEFRDHVFKTSRVRI